MKYDATRRDLLKLGTTVGTGLALVSTPLLVRAQEAGTAPVEMSAFDALRKRRSVRKFEPTPIPKDDLKRILQATRLAPTSGNQQPWKFLVVDDRVKIDELKEACIAARLGRFREREENATPEQIAEQETAARRYYTDYMSAPVYVVILTSGKSQYPDYNHWDGPLAAANLMIAARSLGYGTVFCTDSVPEEITREVFNIPEHLTRICITPIGVPVEWPRQPGKKPWRSFVVKNSF